MVPFEQIEEFLGATKRATRNNVRAACPFCGKPDHFFINTITGLWDCKKCGRDGNQFALLKHWNQLHLVEGAVVDHEKKLITLSEFLKEELEGETQSEIPDKSMPIGYTVLNPLKPKSALEREYIAYLRKRKFTDADFKLYRPGYTTLKERYEGYVLIPIDRDFSVKGFVGRYIYDADADEKLRYENSKSTQFSHLLLGYDEIDYRTENLILVEGPFDKFSVNTELDLHNEPEFKCNSTFGKKVSNEQFKLIKKTNVKTLFFMYDARDAINEIKAKAFEAEKMGFRALCCYLFPNDPGDSNAAELLASLKGAQPPGKFWLDKINKRKLK